MTKTFLFAEIQNIKVTHVHENCASEAISVPKDLMQELGISKYEQAFISNLNNGKRWISYVVEGDEFFCMVSGAVEKTVKEGDHLTIQFYRQDTVFSGARGIHLDNDNFVKNHFYYKA